MESTKLATYQDLFDLPPDVAGEVLHGVLHGTTTDLCTLISMRFKMGIDGPGGWRILFTPELNLERDILVRV